MSGIAKIVLLAVYFLMVTISPCWSVELGERMPDFSLQSFDGNKFARATLEGKPVLLVFWNTWCPDCMRELPEINRLAGELGRKGLTVLAVNTAMNDSESKARGYWEKQAYVFPTGFDHYFEIGQAFGVRGVPTIFLLDSKGVVRYKQAAVPDNMEERLKQLAP